MVLTGKACGPDGVPALAPLPQPATSNANASRTVVCIVNFFIIINLLMLPDLGAPDIWIKAEPPPIQFRRVKLRNVLRSIGFANRERLWIFNFGRSDNLALRPSA